MKSKILGIAVFLLTTIFSFGQCNIAGLTVTPSECNNNGKFFVTINFDHVGTSPKFKVLGNGVNYGTFEYSNLPITIGPLNGDCTTNYEFVVRDNEFESCNAFKTIGTKCCTNECSINFKNVEAGNCEGMLYQLSFDLEYSDDANNGFDLFTNGQFFGYYQYEDLPLNINNFPSSTIEPYNQIVVCANDNSSCCDTISILNPCICNIYRLQGQVIDCNEDTETFSIKLNFKHNLTSDSFQVGGNTTNYGTFGYNQLPITITGLSFSDVTQYEFLIVDQNDAFCFSSFELGKVTECNFDCNISELVVEPYACEDGQFYVDIAFDYENTSIAGFSIVGNGQTYGNFEYGEDFYTLGPLEADCETLYEFIVRDNELTDCRAEKGFNEPICCDADCEIAEFRLDEICEEGKLVGFLFNFNHTSTNGNFVIKANGVNLGTFSYADLPVTINDINFNTQQVQFVVFDSENESCSLSKTYTFECSVGEECDFRDMVLTVTDCNEEGQFYAKLKFKVTSPGEQGFIIKVNGDILDTLAYGQEIYEIGPLEGDCNTLYEFLIYDVENQDCGAVYNFTEKICCDECQISNATLSFLPCEEGKFDVILNFEHENTSPRFRLKINGEAKGPFMYADLPYTIENLTERKVYEIVIFDGENEACRLSVVIPAIECPSSTNDDLAKSVQIINKNEKVELYLDELWGKTQVSIFDITGKFLINSTIENNFGTIEIDHLNSGIYLLRLDNKKINYTRKLIKY